MGGPRSKYWTSSNRGRMDKPRWVERLGTLLAVAMVALFALLLAAQIDLENAQDQLHNQEQLLDKLQSEIQEGQDELERLRELAPFAAAINKHRPDVNPWALAAQLVESSRRWAGERWEQVAWDAVAMGAVESRWQTRAIGSCGEKGPLQVMPSTARWLGVRDLDDWRATIDAAVRYYARVCLPRAGGDTRTAVAVYNAGASRGLDTARRLASRHVERVWAAREAIGRG